MKPGNLSEMMWCQIRRQRKMRIRYCAHRIFGVRFFIGSPLNRLVNAQRAFRPKASQQKL